MKHNTWPSRLVIRTSMVMAIVAFSTLVGCYGPLDRAEPDGMTIQIPWLWASDLPDPPGSGYGMDVYIYRAADVTIVEGVSFQVNSGAQSVPIGGKPYHRVLSPNNWTPNPGGGQYDARIPGVPAGGPYVLYILAWGYPEGLSTEEYVSGVYNSDIGEVELVSFVITSGEETRLTSSQITGLAF